MFDKKSEIVFDSMRLYFAVILLLFSIRSFSQTKATPDTTVETSLTPEVFNKIIDDSKNGGSLDFWTPIKGHEYDGEMIQGGANTKDNIYATKKDIAVIKWALVLTKRGIKKNDLIALFGLLKAREVTSNDIKLIDFGIKKATG